MPRPLAFLVLPLLLLASCASPPPAAQPGAPAVQTAAPDAGWPRQIDTLTGPAVIERRPERIHALSLGYEEILLALAGPERFAAVSTFAVDPSLSNSVAVASRVPRRVSRDPEAIIATEADLIIASTTTRQDLLDRLRAAGVTVLIPPFRETVDNLPEQIRWLGRVVGEDAAAERMVTTLQERLARVDAVVRTKPETARPRVLFITSAAYFVAGDGALRSVLLQRAGGRNAAAEAGIQGDKQVGLESIVAIAPDVIITADTATGDVARQVREQPALAEVPAVKNGRVFSVLTNRVSVLSHYQVRGIEDIARALYPADFAAVTFADFPERF
ncbi:MAG: ABC transporter substrate-binding protein [Chloroflexota bacterium]|nr:ABC transporter substrate-binding protein [Dehalococcoidia bacterium]MDW8252502.1 ABC transporter substrate-binding protein [Chloroflexota bacterium]